MEKKKEVLTVHSGEAEQPFKWSIGKYGSKFLAELRDNKKIFGIRCPRCHRVYVPVRNICGRCFLPLEELVELTGKGTLVTFTVLNYGFVDPETGKERPVPYTWAFIRLDGADNSFVHMVEETDLAKIKIGMRVEPVFEEERRGRLMDIRHFRAIKD